MKGLMERIVITGATGMIGSALVRTCLNRGHSVVALCRPDSGRRRNLPDTSDKFRIVDCGIDSYGTVDAGTIGEADCFFHLAWVGTDAARRNDLALQEENVRCALDAVELAHRLGCSAFVGVGSQAECGRVAGPIRQDTPCFPENGYGAGKLSAMHFTKLRCQQLGIRHEWGRILSVYGPADVPYSMVMSVISDSLKGNRPKCTKGEQMWDYLYCDDCAMALLAMAGGGKDGSVYPIGSGRVRPLSEYIIEICEACRPGLVPDLGARPYMPGQVMYLKADTTSLVADTGWQPTTPFSIGIRNTVKWCRRHCDL